MDFTSGVGLCFVEGLVESSLDQQIGAFRVDPDPGEVRAVPNAPEPGVKFSKINVCAQEARN